MTARYALVPRMPGRLSAIATPRPSAKVSSTDPAAKAMFHTNTPKNGPRMSGSVSTAR